MSGSSGNGDRPGREGQVIASAGAATSPERPRLLTPEMTASLLSVALMFTGLYMVIGVIPIAVRAATGHTSETGLVTAAVAFSTLGTNLAAPTLMSRRSSVRLLTESLLVASTGAALVAVGYRSFALLLVGGTIQGLGLGVSLVVAVALITALAPPGRQSVAVGVYGVAAGAPATLAPSLGLWLASSYGLRAAFIAACAACLLAVGASLTIPHGVAVELRKTHGVRAALRSPTVLGLFAAFALTMFTFGALLNVVPLTLPKVGLGSAATFLVAMGVARVIARPLTGLFGDRVENHRFYIPALLACVLGAVLLALSRSPANIVVAAAFLGLGFGVFQTASFLGMLEGVAKRDDGAVSSLWNFAFDGGVGIGAIVAGVVAGAYGYGPVRWLLAVALVVAIAVVVATPTKDPNRVGWLAR
jgi:predicted MFS family arabinose efflux permease